MRDVEEMEQMTEPRIVKSHLPLYLLHPQLLDNSKVSYFRRTAESKYQGGSRFLGKDIYTF